MTSARAGSSDARNPGDPQHILNECCEFHTVCRLQLVHTGYSVRATFGSQQARTTSKAQQPDTIELLVVPEEGGEPILPGAIACVSFSQGNLFCAFVGCLDEVKKGDGREQRLMMPIPKQVTTTNLRRSFRVPVLPDSGLETIVQLPDRPSFSVGANDIGQFGLEIEFSPGQIPELLVGSLVPLELRFRGEIVQRIGNVRRIDGTRCGLLFGHIDDKADKTQIERMNGMVLSLQQVWLKSRLK